jgi:hypothetical protein
LEVLTTDFLIEILFEVFVEAMFAIVPDGHRSKAVRVIAVTIALAVLIGVIALFIWGIVLLEDGNKWGDLPIAVSILISLAWMIAGIARACKQGE